MSSFVTGVRSARLERPPRDRLVEAAPVGRSSHAPRPGPRVRPHRARRGRRAMPDQPVDGRGPSAAPDAGAARVRRLAPPSLAVGLLRCGACVAVGAPRRRRRLGASLGVGASARGSRRRLRSSVGVGARLRRRLAVGGGCVAAPASPSARRRRGRAARRARTRPRRREIASPPSAGCHTSSPSAFVDPLALGVLDAAAGLLLGELGLALDVDAPAGEPRREAGVLAFLADRERQLEVGDDDLGGAGVLVDAHLAHLRRRERLHHELGRVVAVGDDVDLLAAQLVDDHAARASRARRRTRRPGRRCGRSTRPRSSCGDRARARRP